MKEGSKVIVRNNLNEAVAVRTVIKLEHSMAIVHLPNLNNHVKLAVERLVTFDGESKINLDRRKHKK